MNIFETFSNKHGNTTKALNYLNAKLGKSYVHGRYAQWAAGRALPHINTYRLIHMEVLDYVLENSALNEATQEMFLMQIRLPEPDEE